MSGENNTEEAWMRELNQIGTEKGVRRFPCAEGQDG